MLQDNISIIVVEDDDDVREELVEILSSLFKHVAEAKDGCEGLEYIQKYKPDVLISDISMPCLDGLDMLREVKKAHKDIVEHIFEPYFTTKHEHKGTGLGLYMSKTIVNDHINGDVLVSNTDNGAIFTIIIPLM
jgi:CheY-like chemotaxis protein